MGEKNLSKKKNIGIVTINDNNNYGNRLQAYALQEFLKDMDCNPKHIQTKKNKLADSVKRTIKCILNYNHARKHEKRGKLFKNFNKEFIEYSEYKIKDTKNLEKYDAFLVGSDQVWNPHFDTTSDINFLSFVEEKDKRNSFSASFGIDEIPKEQENKYRDLLSQFKYLSVREDSGKEIIEKLTGREDVTVLLDPTMLIDIEKWDKLIKKPENLKNQKYILNYFLGTISEQRKNAIEKFAKENDCMIINILDRNSDFYATGPSEFLYLEKNATLVCTDSFHSTIFAILFNRPFMLFNREDKKVSMNSRLITLLNKFSISDRIFNGKLDSSVLKTNYNNINIVLEKEREKARDFINKIIKEK